MLAATGFSWGADAVRPELMQEQREEKGEPAPRSPRQPTVEVRSQSHHPESPIRAKRCLAKSMLPFAPDP